MQLAQRAPRTLTRNADSAAKLVGILTARCGVPEESIGKVLTRCVLLSAWQSDGLSLTAARMQELGAVRWTVCLTACWSVRAPTHSAQWPSRQVDIVAAMPALALLCRSPAVLSLSEDGLVERVEFLEALGLSQEQLAKVTVAHPQVRDQSMQGCAATWHCMKATCFQTSICVRLGLPS